MTPKILDIQRRLDEKLINPKDLTPGQRNALDEAFDQGILKGYDSVGEMIKERRLASEDIAGEIKKRLQPLGKAQLGAMALTRGTLVALGDIIGSFTPYILDSKKLASEARTYALAGKSPTYFPSANNIRIESGQKNFEFFSNALKNLPGLKALGAFRNTTKVLDQTVAASKNLSANSRVLSQLGATEAKSQLFGMTGAGAGSLTYDLVNFPLLFNNGLAKDLAALDENEVNRLPFPEKALTHALDNMFMAGVFNLGAFAAMSGLGLISRGAKSAAAVYTEPMQKIVERDLMRGQTPSIQATIQGEEVIPELVKRSSHWAGMEPRIGAAATQQRKKQLGLSLANLRERYMTATNSPIYNMNAIALAGGQSIERAYAEKNNLIDNMYAFVTEEAGRVGLTAEKYMNMILKKKIDATTGQPLVTEEVASSINKIFPEGMDIPFIPIKNTKNTLDALLSDRGFFRGVTPGQALRGAARGLQEPVSDPVVTVAKEMKDRVFEFGLKNKGDFVTPAEFNALRILFNKNYKNTKFVGGDLESINSILKSLENDFNFIKMPKEEILKMENNPRLAKVYNGIRTELGQQQADNFYKEFYNDVVDYGDSLRNANQMFSNIVNFYNNEAYLIKKLRTADAAALTPRALLDIPGASSVSQEKAFSELVRSVVEPKSSAVEVKQFAELLGVGTQQATKTKEGKLILETAAERDLGAREMMGAIAVKKFDEAFNNSVVKTPTGGIKGKETEFMEPLITYQGAPKSTDELLEFLREASGTYRKELKAIIDRTHKLGFVSDDIFDPKYFKLQKKAVTPEVLREATAVGPIKIIDKKTKEAKEYTIQEIPFLTKEVEAGKTEFGELREGLLSNIFGKGLVKKGEARLQPFETSGLREAAEKRYQVQIKDPKTGKFRDVTKQEDLASKKYIENIQFRTYGPQGFNVDNFRRETGFNSPEGREKWAEYFKIRNNISIQESRKLVDSIEDNILGMENLFVKTPGPATSSMVQRGVVFALASGIPAASAAYLYGFGGGILGFALTHILAKSAGLIMTNPKYSRTWNNLYRGQSLLTKNSLRAMDPPMRAKFADLFNYSFEDDPDAPIIDPNDIPEERVIKYLQGTKLKSIVTDKGIYDMLNENLKDRFDPVRKRFRELDNNSKNDIKSFTQGLQVANFRSELIDNLDSPNGAKVAELPRVRDFITNPMDLQVPASAKTSLVEPVIPQVTADVYQGFFPRDTIGTTIAQQQTSPTPPMMKKGGFVNAKV